MLDLFLFIIFVAVASVVVRAVHRKIPLLVQVPEQLIEESFTTRPSRVMHYVGPVVTFFREDRFRDVYYAVLVWALHRLRLWLLRLERMTFRMLEILQARNPKLSTAEERYWSELRQWKQESRENGTALPEAVLNPEAPPEIVPKVFPKKSKAPEDS